MPTILPNEDEDTSANVARSFKKMGMKVMMSASVEKVDVEGDICHVHIKDKKGAEVLVDCDVVLSAVGVITNLENMGLEETGINVERTKIARQGDGTVAYRADNKEDGAWVQVDENSPVSMNVWGFTPDYFEYSEQMFKEFLSDPANISNLKSEFFIPMVVNKMINDGTATCKVLDTTSKWFGVTYSEDRPDTVARIAKLVADGVYPNKLF